MDKKGVRAILPFMNEPKDIDIINVKLMRELFGNIFIMRG